MNERDRIELLMKSYNLSPSQFADKTGIQRASVSHILSGRNKPSLEVMLKIYEAFPGLSMEWLMAGVGEGPGNSVSDVVETVSEPVLQPQSVGLFGGFDGDSAENNGRLPFVDPSAIEPMQPVVKKPRINPVVPQPEKRKVAQSRQVAQPSVVQRKIKEIRIFYTDGTYETLVPENKV